jgi:hypothetical protein
MHVFLEDLKCVEYQVCVGVFGFVSFLTVCHFIFVFSVTMKLGVC